MSVRIVVVDDHSMMRKSICTLLDGEPDFAVVGEAADGEAGVETVLREKPDIVVLDVAMPMLNGIEAARKLRGKMPDLRILMLSMHGSASHVEHAISAGADGYLVKADAADEVVEAVRQICSGGRYFSRHLEPGSGAGA